MPDRRHHFLFSTQWNTGARIGEACMLTPESFELDGPRPFVRILSEKVRSRRCRPPRDAVRLVPLTDAGYIHQVRSWMATERPRCRESLWAATDETMRNWLKAAVKRANDDGVHFPSRRRRTPSATPISCTCSITVNRRKSFRR